MYDNNINKQGRYGWTLTYSTYGESTVWHTLSTLCWFSFHKVNQILSVNNNTAHMSINIISHW